MTVSRRIFCALVLCLASCSRGPNDGELVQEDQKLLVEFQMTQNEYFKKQIDKSEYQTRLKQLHAREETIFTQVRSHKFSDMTAASYFTRSRMKFPSPITEEQKRLNGQLPGSPPAHP